MLENKDVLLILAVLSIYKFGKKINPFHSIFLVEAIVFDKGKIVKLNC
jgi:hypothetical protein